MRQLSESLLAAQKEASRVPCIGLSAGDNVLGVKKLTWSRLYSGAEPDCYHGVTMPGDGSLIRVRVTPPEDSRKLYRQRVASPGEQSDFSQWVYTGQYNAVVVACCSLGTEVSIFWIKSDRKIYHLKSTDCGASWGSPQLLDYAPSTAINGIAAAYKAGGDIALFFACGQTLYVMKRLGGGWQSKVAWDKSTGDLSGVATAYDGDWALVVTGKDTGGNFRLWSLVYGDGGEVPAGTWSALKEVASAPSDGYFEYSAPYIDEPDVGRFFFVESFSGTEAYDRPFWSHSVPEVSFLDGCFGEPVPFNLSSQYGLAIAHHGDYVWLSNACGVWRAALTPGSHDLAADVLALRQEVVPGNGRLVVELDNSGGKYASPGEGDLAVLDIGCQLDFSPGYVTSEGSEVSTGPAFVVQSYEHTSAGGKASLLLYAADGWQRLEDWVARHQFRWNKESDEACVKDILVFLLARVGLKLEVKSQSQVITSYCPDFSVNPGNRGDTVIARLLSFVPDVLFIEGGKAYLLYPQSADSSVYSYGGGHPILEGRYRASGWRVNRVQVEGYDPQAGEPVVADSFAWNEIERFGDRLEPVYDRNIDTASGAAQRGEAHLRRAEIGSAGGAILVPVNSAQQLYDVVDITDSRAGLAAEKKRVLGIVLVYRPRRGEYEQRLTLGEA